MFFKGKTSFRRSFPLFLDFSFHENLLFGRRFSRSPRNLKSFLAGLLHYYLVNLGFLISAFLAEKIRTPPRNFLWWCYFYGVNLRKALSGRELSAKLTEGERVAMKLAQAESYAVSFRRLRRHLPPWGRLFVFTANYTTLAYRVFFVYYFTCPTVHSVINNSICNCGRSKPLPYHRSQGWFFRRLWPICHCFTDS